MARTISPHRIAPAAAVQADTWFCISANGASTPIVDHIADFDAATILKFVRALRVDGELVRERCELVAGDRISVIAQWHSLRTDLRGTGKAVDVPPGENNVEIAVDVPPGVSGGTLVLRTYLILAVPVERGRSPFSAGRPATILWQDRMPVALEGTGPRFPVEVRKFDSPGLADAGWMLDWRPSSPDAMFMGSVRLFLNEHHKLVVEAAKSSPGDSTQKAIVSAINADVARSLITGMLRNADFVNSAVTHQEGTVGQVVGDLIAYAFPGENLGTLYMQLENEPETFAARLQSRFKVFGTR
jgi:hypothetical protein